MELLGQDLMVCLKQSAGSKKPIKLLLQMKAPHQDCIDYVVLSTADTKDETVIKAIPVDRIQTDN